MGVEIKGQDTIIINTLVTMLRAINNNHKSRVDKKIGRIINETISATYRDIMAMQLDTRAVWKIVMIAEVDNTGKNCNSL